MRDAVDLREASVWVDGLWEPRDVVEARVDTLPGMLATRCRFETIAILGKIKRRVKVELVMPV